MLKFDWVITNGCVDDETISKRIEKGWNFVTTLPAQVVHPHALSTDKVTIFSRYDKHNINREETTSEASE